MKRSQAVALALLLALMACLLPSPLAAAGGGAAWKPLFDGKTLDGWHKVGDGSWVVDQGAIVGKTQEAAKLYGLLVSDKIYKDFVVKFKFKSLQGNSGFYVRGRIEAPDRAHGLQIEIDPRNNTGGIYESYGRRWISQPKPEQVEQYYKLDQWNTMMITAEGGDVVVRVNGVRSAELQDDPSPAEGHFIMQMHAGNEMLVMLKDVQVFEAAGKPLLARPQTVRPAADGSLVLHASVGRAVGPKIEYMPDCEAFGWWTDQDRAEWDLDVMAAGKYDVWLQWSVADSSAGNPYVFEIADGRLSGKIESTGGRDVYRKAKLGQVELKAGPQSAVFKPGGQFERGLLDLREIRLVPAGGQK